MKNQFVIVCLITTGFIGGASYSATESILSGDSASEVLTDTLTGAATGSLTGGVFGGLGYGANKLLNGVKGLASGSSSTQSGHITEMAKKDLSSIGTSSGSNATGVSNSTGKIDPYKLLEERGIPTTLSADERAAADAYDLVAKKASSASSSQSNRITEAIETSSQNKYTPVEGFDEWLNKGEANNKVYFGIKDGKAQYTGITKQLNEVRLQQHNSAGKGFSQLDTQYSGLTRNQARAIEQYYIEHGPNELNKINSISPTNNKYYNDSQIWASEYISKN